MSTDRVGARFRPVWSSSQNPFEDRPAAQRRMQVVREQHVEKKEI